MLHRALADASRLRILQVLREAGEPLDARALAEQVSLHPNTVRSHLEILQETQLVSARREQRTRPGRPRIVYEALPEETVARSSEQYRLLAEVLASSVAQGEDAARRVEATARAWGHYLVEGPAPFTSVPDEEAIGEVVRLLEGFGFQPELQPGDNDTRVVMHSCPFEDAARMYENVVCPIHLGLIQGALAELGAHVEARRIEPFVDGHVCVAHLE